MSILDRATFIRNVIVVASGTAAAQLVTLLCSPIITRIYGPEAFGTLGVFVSMIAMIVPLATLSYPLAMVIADTNEDAIALGVLSTLTSIILSILLIISIAGLYIADYNPFFDFLEIQIGSKEYSLYIIFSVPIFLVLASLIYIYQQYLYRRELFNITSKIAAVQSVIGNSLKVFLGYMHPSPAILTFSTILGSVFHSIILCACGIQKISGSVSVGINDLKRVAKAHSDFPCYRAPQAFLNATSQGLPIVLLSVLYGASSAGYYSLAQLALGAPLALLGQSVYTAFYPRFTKIHRAQQGSRRHLVGATFMMLGIGAVPLVTVIMFGPSLFAALFGVDWKVSGDYAQILSIWYFSGLLSRPAFAAIPVLGLQRALLLLEAVLLMARVVILGSAALYGWSAIEAIGAISVVGFTSNAFLIALAISRS